MTLALAAYRLATHMAQPLLARHLARRARAGKESPAHLHERRGEAPQDVPPNLLWLHGASLGETAALAPLVARLLRDTPANLLLTCQTLSAHAKLAEAHGNHPRIRVAFAPLDTPGYARTFLDGWRPRAAIFAESEVWPNLLATLQSRAILAALVNARLNRRSVERWAKHPRTAREVFSALDPILAADEATRDALQNILQRSIPHTDNLKFAAVPPAPNPQAVAALCARIGERDAWCALSVHAEEAEPLRAFAAAVRGEHPVAVVVPRYPGTLDHLADADTIVLPGFGITSLACAVSRFALVGGSLHPSLKGHNPLEPMHLGLPVATGMHTESFRAVTSEYYGQLGISQRDALARAATWLADPEQLARDRAVARDFAASRADIVDRIMDHLAPLLESVS